MAITTPAISTRIEHRSRSRAKGQRRHDMREGPQPKYIDPNQTNENSILVEPTKEAALDKLCEKRAAQLGRQRSRKSTAAIATCGIITFSKQAQTIVNDLPPDEQDRLLLRTAQNLADAMGTTLHGAVVHRDETALHMHYRLAAVRIDGRPISKVVDTSNLQDVAAQTWLGFGIGRGTPKQVRKDLGESANNWVHRTVQQLHEDLPEDLENTQRDAAERTVAAQSKASDEIAAAQARVTDAEAARNAAESKLQQTQERLETAQSKLETAQGKSERLDKRVRTYQQRLDAQDAKFKEVQRELAEAKAEVERLKSVAPEPTPVSVERPTTKKRQMKPSAFAPTETVRVVTGQQTMKTGRRFFPAETIDDLAAAAWQQHQREVEAQITEARANAAREQYERDVSEQIRREAEWLATWSAVSNRPDALSPQLINGPFRERYGVTVVERRTVVTAPPQDATPRQIAAALYRAGIEAGWSEQHFRVRGDIAEEVMRMASENGRLHQISFRDEDQQKRLDELKATAAAAKNQPDPDPDDDPLGDPPKPRPSSGPDFG